MASDSTVVNKKAVEFETQHRRLSKPWYILFLVVTTIGILLVVNQVFLLRAYTRVSLIDNSYLYLLLALFLSLVFVLFPASKGAPRGRVPWYDIALFLTTVLVGSFFAWQGPTIIVSAYEFEAPAHFTVGAAILWLLALEGARRTGGTSLFIIVLVISVYPMFAGYLPGVFTAFNVGVLETARFHALSIQSIVGMPLQIVGTLLIGFIMMGVALVVTGGGEFFINLASALLGSFRGGPAKISILASAFFGTMSGSVVSNVLATGTITIPTMKRIGYPPHLAAAVEACASTGGVLMPPIMGAAAFLMAAILNVPYLQIAAAAVIPSVLYYFGLMVQVDAYAARAGLKGLPRTELPPVLQTLKDGWFYIVSLVALVWLLLILRQEAMAPFYATGLLLLLCNARKEVRMNWRRTKELVASVGRTVAELAGILAGVGLIMGSLTVTGMATTIASDLVSIAGGNTFLLLIMGAVASFILGMGTTMVACYVLVATVLAPALLKAGLNPMAAHMFILYWGMISFITPPVAVGAYAAASIAHSPPMRTGFEAMRLGTVIYFIPFFFVLNPVLVLQGVTIGGLSVALGKAVVGIFLTACGLQGYIAGIGILKSDRVGWLSRSLLVVGGILTAWPSVEATIIGLPVAAAGVLGCFVANHREARALETNTQ